MFGAEITRVTDPTVDGFSGQRAPGYSCYPMENASGSLLALADHLYELPSLTYQKRLGGSAGLDLGGDRGIRWDPDDPDVFYFVGPCVDGAKRTALMKYEVSSDTQTCVHDFANEFPDMEWLLLTAYAEPSVSRRYWGFAVCADTSERGEKIGAVTYDRGPRPSLADRLCLTSIRASGHLWW